MSITSFPDRHITISNLIAEGDKVAYQEKLEGTHKGVFMGLPQPIRAFK
jgi:predicted ester cyclase